MTSPTLSVGSLPSFKKIFLIFPHSTGTVATPHTFTTTPQNRVVHLIFLVVYPVSFMLLYGTPTEKNQFSVINGTTDINRDTEHLTEYG